MQYYKAFFKVIPSRMQVEDYATTKFAFLECDKIAESAGLMNEVWKHIEKYVTKDTQYIGFSTSPQDTPIDKMNFRMGVTVPVDFDETLCPGLKYLVINGGRILTLYHKGPYDTLPAVYGQLIGELYDKKYKCRCWPFEIYLNSPDCVAKEDILTKVCFQIE